MYGVMLAYDDYRHWQVYTEWEQLFVFSIPFDRYVRSRYPEVIGIREYSWMSLTFEFESQSHYHWFLLQVM